MAKGRQSSGDKEKLFRASQKSKSRTSQYHPAQHPECQKSLLERSKLIPLMPDAVRSSVEDAVPYEPKFHKVIEQVDKMTRLSSPECIKFKSQFWVAWTQMGR